MRAIASWKVVKKRHADDTRHVAHRAMVILIPYRPGVARSGRLEERRRTTSACRRGGYARPLQDLPANGTSRLESRVHSVYAGLPFRESMIFFRFLRSNPFCKPQSRLRYLALSINSWHFRQIYIGALSRPKGQPQTGGQGGNIAECGHVVLAAYSIFGIAYGNEIILRNEATCLGRGVSTDSGGQEYLATAKRLEAERIQITAPCRNDASG
jgi:hypothetical protein